jgi:hypothetical protein
MVSVELDDLYGVPLDRFVPERAALVRALRSAGEREQAAAVAALRKPSVAAWAVNQLVRTSAPRSWALRASDACARRRPACCPAGLTRRARPPIRSAA